MSKNTIIEYIKICRPEHWLKNIFIVFGHAVAIVIYFQLSSNINWTNNITLAFLSLIPASLIASANYILNEILDAQFDKFHPTKKHRGIPAGIVKVPVLWGIMVVLIIIGITLGLIWFENIGYTIALLLLLFSGFVYNVSPIRLKDKAFFDVIAESFNNPIRLWLGWYALLPAQDYILPPSSITLAWWSFGALLMTGKRYSEYRFIGDKKISGSYRKSFNIYNEKSLILAMIFYANVFCFCTGYAMSTYPLLNNLVLIFPFITFAVLAYFNFAISEVGAKLEPEKLLQNKWVVFFTALAMLLSIFFLYTGKKGTFNVNNFLKQVNVPITPKQYNNAK